MIHSIQKRFEFEPEVSSRYIDTVQNLQAIGACEPRLITEMEARENSLEHFDLKFTTKSNAQDPADRLPFEGSAMYTNVRPDMNSSRVLVFGRLDIAGDGPWAAISDMIKGDTSGGILNDDLYPFSMTIQNKSVGKALVNLFINDRVSPKGRVDVVDDLYTSFDMAAHNGLTRSPLVEYKKIKNHFGKSDIK